MTEEIEHHLLDGTCLGTAARKQPAIIPCYIEGHRVSSVGLSWYNLIDKIVSLLAGI